jgi:hypothetical protein
MVSILRPLRQDNINQLHINLDNNFIPFKIKNTLNIISHMLSENERQQHEIRDLQIKLAATSHCNAESDVVDTSLKTVFSKATIPMKET